MRTTNSASEAVARRTRRALVVPLADTPGASSSIVISDAGIHDTVTPLLIQQFENVNTERKGSDEGASARQGRTGLWKEKEIDELRRLVGIHTGPTGLISWVKIVEVWKSLNLGERTKASLMAKWRDVNNKPPKKNGENDQKMSQEGTQGTSTTHSERNAETDIPVRQKQDIGCANTTPPVEEVSENGIYEIFYKNLKIAKRIGCKPNARKPPPRVSGKNVQPLIEKVNGLMETEMVRKIGTGTGRMVSWSWLSILVYAGAKTVAEINGKQRMEQVWRAKEWFKESYKEMETLRSIIGKATAELNRRKSNKAPTNTQIRNIRMLMKRYRAESSTEITSLVEKLKARLMLLRSRIELRKSDEQRQKLRQSATKVLFRGKSTRAEENKTDIDKVRRYWQSIVGITKSFNHKNKDLVDWGASLEEVKEIDNLSDYLNLDLWKDITQKAKSWKAHGPDGLQGFWWKVFKSANASLYSLAHHHLTTGNPLPDKWISEGRIILIHKSGPVNDPSNFRPIACLNTCYKLVTSFISAVVDHHVRKNNILPLEQIALQRGTWGCTHALVLDQTLVADAQNQKQKPISVAWVDYSKAFDSIPHGYINWILKVVKIPLTVRNFVKTLIGSWKVKYEMRDHSAGRVVRSKGLRIKSGVLQGDSFSPLLFCIAMAPISYAINNTKIKYITACGKGKKLQVALSHIFYMDDLKLYGNSEKELSVLIEKVEQVSVAISMKMNAKKCAQAHFTPKRLLNNQDEHTLSGVGTDIPTLEGGAMYKYLGIEQTLGLHDSDAWKRVEEKCCTAAKVIWESDLTFRQKINAYNCKIVPALKYVVTNTTRGVGKYISVLERGERFDKRIRKLLTKSKVRYKASCVARLYLPAGLGGYGLKSIKDSLQEATIYSWAYLCTKNNLKGSLNLFVSMSNRGKRSVISDASAILKKYNISTEMDPISSAVTINEIVYSDAKTLARYVVEQLRLNNDKDRLRKWSKLELSGRVMRSSDIDKKMSFAWLQAGKLSSTGVRNVTAVQEGCLLTRTHPSFIGADRTSCRACGKAAETIEHVVAGCSRWLSTLYIDRHDSVARNIYYRLCEKYELKPPHYSQKVDNVVENDRIKLYWNQPVQTKSIIRHNKPDILVFEKVTRKCTVIEIVVSWFTGMCKQRDIKINRYCVNGNWEDELKIPYPHGDNLLRELTTSGWRAVFLPVIIGTCGEVLEGLLDLLKQHLELSNEKAEDCIERMGRSAALGTSRIIQNHLSQG